jgi:hypothetical protein
MFCTVALNETCTLHALCICHVVMDVIVNAVLGENVCDVGLLSDFVN